MRPVGVDGALKEICEKEELKRHCRNEFQKRKINR
jgi:hypothetical protein